VTDDERLARVLKGLEEAAEFAKTYRFEMTDDYRELIERVEAMPRNQSGSDRSGPWLGSYADAMAWRELVKPAPRE
jgi:hypothetical protein